MARPVPWPQPYQVEQDLILMRLMLEIARHELLRGEFVLRGGTLGSNSSSRHSTAGVPSIPPTSSRWSEPARSSRTASSSNDPTNQQAVTLTPHDTLIHRT
jgi:hypothetical protein